MKSITRFSAVSLILVAIALTVGCAPAPVNTAPALAPSVSGNVPLVQIQNDSYAEATIYMEGARLTTVAGSQSVLFPIQASRIPGNGQVHFTAKYAALDETVTLPIVEYQQGRKMRISLKPMTSASRAY